MPFGILVSNPHRYGQKLVAAYLERNPGNLFQTLIGTVKRELARSEDPLEAPFQTLIGTVKRLGGPGGRQAPWLGFKPS